MSRPEPAFAIPRRPEPFHRLHSATLALAEALMPTEVVEVGVRQALVTFGAEAAALWRVEEQGARVSLLGCRGNERHRFEEAPIRAMSKKGEPVWLPSPEASTSACLPLISEGRCIGAMELRFPTSRPLTPPEHGLLVAFGQQCAQALRRALRAEAERAGAEARLRLLAEVGDVLSSSLDYETTLRNVIALCLPSLGDFGFFDVVEGSSVRRLALAHEDPVRQALIDKTAWVRSERTDMNLCALSSGVPGMEPDIDDAWLRKVAVSPEHLALIRQLSFGSMLTVPLKYQGELFGALTLFYNAPGRQHGPEDVETALDVARRAAAAVINARLYRDSQAAVRIRNDFLSIASHELRTPLTSLTLHLSALRRMVSASTPEQPLEFARIQHKVERTGAQLGRVTALVEQLLDVSRITAGRLELELDEVDLSALVREVMVRFDEQLQRAGSPVTLSADAPVVGRWDRNRLDQVITNLVSNALKYGKGTALEIRVERCEQTARLRVRDEGVGIDPKDHSRIFERFERASSSRGQGGIGLGLWIVKQIVDLHGGHIHVESAPGRGAAFTVELPR